MTRTCFGWRLLPPELILTYAGAYLHGVAINESELLSIRHLGEDWKRPAHLSQNEIPRYPLPKLITG